MRNGKSFRQMSHYKGGASIYVDQCLIDGYLKEKDICSLHGSGSLQLTDDFGTWIEDAENGHQTLMTLSAGAGFLDEIVWGRLLSFRNMCFEN